MLKAGANWEVISQMMSYISDKAAQVESLAADIAAGNAGEATPQSKPVFSTFLSGKSSKSPMDALRASPKKGSNALKRLGINVSEAARQLDLPMLQQLAPMAGAKVAALEAEATNANCSRGKKGKMIKAAKAEALIRRVLAQTPPGLFQHMMRTINSQVLVLLDTRRSGYVDLALLIMCLLALCDAPVVDRLSAAYRVMQWRNGDDPITRRDAFDYVAALRVIFAPAHDAREWTAHAPEAMDGQFINVQRWVSMVTDSRLGFGLFEAMPHLCKPLA
jgi:hypothetical protein